MAFESHCGGHVLGGAGADGSAGVGADVLDEASFFLGGAGLGAGFDDAGLDDDGFVPGGGARLGVDGADGGLARVGGAGVMAGANFGVDAGVA